MRLLLVEDDPLLGEGLQAALKIDGYTADWVQDGESAWAALNTDEFDLLLLDLGIPRLSGLDLLTRLRKKGIDIPVLILTARDAVHDRVKGLDSGADDYLVKPFDLNELLARLRVLSRRHTGRHDPLVRYGKVTLNPATREVHIDDQPVMLSHREFSLLELLLQRVGTVVSKQRLRDALYGWEGEVESNTLEVYIHHLRRKIGRESIRTVRGVGYMMPEIPK
jgi:two-component system response regulator QseB